MNRAETFQLLAILLQYPDAELVSVASGFTTAVGEVADRRVRDSVASFVGWLASVDDGVAARTYVDTFDLRRRTTLNLTWYLHGDTRRRGMALLTLKQRYRAAGLTPPDGELPDHLTVMLEFAAIAGRAVGEAPLRMHRRELATLREGLHATHSPYAWLVEAVCDLVGQVGDPIDAPGEQSEDEDPYAELDWNPPLDVIAPAEYLSGYAAGAGATEVRP